jgi:hypothetical protein
MAFVEITRKETVMNELVELGYVVAETKGARSGDNFDMVSTTV